MVTVAAPCLLTKCWRRSVRELAKCQKAPSVIFTMELKNLTEEKRMELLTIFSNNAVHPIVVSQITLWLESL